MARKDVLKGLIEGRPQGAETQAPPRAPGCAIGAEVQRLFPTDGSPLGQVRFDRNFCTLKLRLTSTDGFEDWLLAALPGLHADWLRDNPPPVAVDDPDQP